MNVHELETPCLLVDLDRLARNIERMQAAIGAHGPRFRPHIKTHKIPEIARLQRQAGASGIAVAKVGEAEVFAAKGCNDIVIAYPVVGESKWRRIADLARDAKITVNVDSVIGAHGLSQAAARAGVTIGVQLEVDSGLGRCGFAPDALADLEALARTVLDLPGLALEGVTTHRGLFFPGASEMTPEEAGRREGEIIVRVADGLRARGVAIREVTAGGTMTGAAVAAVAGITEVRAGTYVFNDLMQLGFGSASRDDLALTALCTVVSCHGPGRATVDGGSKTFSGDRGVIGLAREKPEPIARAVDRPEVVVERLTEEHGMLGTGSTRLEVGDRLAFYPTHACTAVNLADELYGVRGGQVEVVWPVLARGRRT